MIGLSFFAKGHTLPVLSFVFTEVEDLEGLAAFDAEEALSCNVDREATEVATDPAAAKFLGDGECGARTAEEVCDEGTFT